MEFFGSVISAVYGMFTREFSLYGFNISFWQVMIFCAVVSMVFSFIRRVFE